MMIDPAVARCVCTMNVVQSMSDVWTDCVVISARIVAGDFLFLLVYAVCACNLSHDHSSSGHQSVWLPFVSTSKQLIGAPDGIFEENNRVPIHTDTAERTSKKMVKSESSVFFRFFLSRAPFPKPIIPCCYCCFLTATLLLLLLCYLVCCGITIN